jgi:molybdopterin/thiamine biosynthesis adenylyltransferase/rhodanese-related sulfurtransferase/molybdopterin converting factor small subunit
MAITVLLPVALRGYAGHQDRVDLAGATAGEILDRLAARFPELKPHLFDEAGALRHFVNVYVNDEDIRYLQQQATPVQEGDTLTIVPSVAGGTGNDPVSLSREEIERYSRHLIMPEVALGGQKKLKQAKVLCIGTGGLGSPLALYLAAAGVGRLGLVDFDVVDCTNLQRQIIHGTSDIGRSKLDSARDAIADINPHVQVDTYDTRLTSDNAMEILKPYDVIVDGTDNFPTRYLVNDACVLLDKPNVYGSIFRFEGQASVFWAARGPCYRCLYPEPPPPGLVPSCAEGGVLGILPGVIGVIQATEAVKLILGNGEPLIGRLLLYNALTMKFQEMKLRKDPDCPICGEHPTVTGLIDYEFFCGIGADDHEPPEPGTVVTATQLKAELDQRRPIHLVDVREPHEYEICRIPGADLIPQGDLERRIHELDRDWDIVMFCRSGGRSARTAKFLREAGFRRVRNLTGGILAWSDKVDPSVPKY